MRRDGWRSRNIAARCDVCGAWPEEIHLPLKRHGFFCAEHCPCCNQAEESGPPAPAPASVASDGGNSDGE